MAYPGEKPVLTAAYPLQLGGTSYITIDGLTSGSQTNYEGYGAQGNFVHDITIRNFESFNHYRGIWMMQDLHNLVIESSVIYDSRGEHAIYLGCQDLVNSNITIRGNILYHNAYTGFQHNGRVTNLLVENNIIHSNNLGGISLLQGVSYSTIQNNLVFNNNRQGIVFFNYTDANPLILPFDQTHNLIQNNTIWEGRYQWNHPGNIEPASMSAIIFNNEAGTGSFDYNIIRNNALATYDGPSICFTQADYADTTVVENNLFYRASGDSRVMTYGATDYSMAAFNAFSPLFRNNLFADPLFQNVSLNYNLTPEKFIFDLLANSPALDLR